MKRFIWTIFYFFCLSILFYVSGICIWGEFAPKTFKKNLSYRIGDNSQMHRRLIDLRNASSIDILFLGSSHAYRGFDTRVFKESGINSFNMGSSAQTIIQTELLLRRYLDVLSPQIIIFEVNPDSFSSDGVESSLDIICNDRNDWLSIDMALKVNHLKTYNTLIYALYKDLFNPKLKNEGHDYNKEDKYITNGYVERKLQFFSGLYSYHYKWEFNMKQLKAFNNILLILKERNIKCYFVQAPISNIRYSLQDKKDEFDDFVNDKGEYYNFNELCELVDTIHFYDSHHLNQKGVEIFNKNLIDKLFKDKN